MKWKDEYAIGIPELDNQHKTLIEFLTDFEQAFEGKAHWNTVHPLIVRARGFVRFHFAVEESVMQIVNFPGFLAHRAEHQSVLQQFEALEHRVLRKEMKQEVLPKITSWLFQHIIESDKPFAQYAIDRHSDLAPTGIK
ncbi:MAG TPA: bacteriohemerythrin [Burkholderiales bacterium]